MSDRRLVWATLADLITRLEEAVTPLLSGSAEDTPRPASIDHLEDLEKELRKLGRTQFKANALAEDQNARIARVLDRLEEEQVQQADLIETLVANRVVMARTTWAQSLFPALDGLDRAIESGRAYVSRAEGPTRAQFAGWLKGVYLVRERLLTHLEAEGITPIPTVGRAFDPYLHIAVATTAEAKNGTPSGTIVAEERRGYRTEEDVLRFADVVVYRSRSHMENS
jgi:molecular chaperone GrpE